MSAGITPTVKHSDTSVELLGLQHSTQTEERGPRSLWEVINLLCLTPYLPEYQIGILS